VAAPLSDQLEVAPGFELSIGNFEGPFDLLLNLISRHQLDITEVALSRVTEEFIKYVRQLEAIDELEQASEFLVIAATLLDLKIASLLPKGEVVDPEDVALLRRETCSSPASSNTALSRKFPPGLPPRWQSRPAASRARFGWRTASRTASPS
jgi:hypothetical protein